MTDKTITEKVIISHYQGVFHNALTLKLEKMKHYNVDFFKRLHKRGFIGILIELSRKGARVDALLDQYLVPVDSANWKEPDMTQAEILDLMLDLINYAMDGYIQYCREQNIDCVIDQKKLQEMFEFACAHSYPV